MILPMSRVEVVGPRERLAAALAFLQARGVLQLRAPPAGVAREEPAAAAGGDEGRLEASLRRIDRFAERAPLPRRGQPEPLPPAGSQAFEARMEALEREADALEARRVALLRERDAVTRFGQLLVALAPLGHGLDPRLEPELHGLVLRTDPGALALLEGELRRITEGACEVRARPLDAKHTGVLAAVPRACGRAVSELLFERGVDEVTLPREYAGKTVVEMLLLLAARERALPGELARAEADLARFLARAGASLGLARRAAAVALELRRAEASAGHTRFAFVVSGYMPAAQVPALREAARAELGPDVAILAREPAQVEWPEVPVVLRNRAAVRPFQRLLVLLPLPVYGSVDPTPWLAVFFPLLFGLVLGDAAFGVVGILVALVAWRARWGGAVGRDLAVVALCCSAAAAGFGLLFGEALGELGAQVGLRPLLMHRRSAMMSFLALALVVGGVHVALGIVLGVAASVRAGHAREAVGRGARLLLLLASAAGIGAVAGWLPRDALVPSLAAGGALLLVAVLAEGPLALLELVLGLGNVLSYSRLMALGLASVMLAEAANAVATALEPAAAGLALAVLLHAVNFTLGLVSPAIAALRLNYVEFFDKFYDAGGAEFHAFGRPG